jgi:hypothetical protein
LSEEGLVGLGAGLEDEFADPELGVAEEGGLVGGGEGACDGEDFLVDGSADGLRELLGQGLALGGQGCARHSAKARRSVCDRRWCV